MLECMTAFRLVSNCRPREQTKSIEEGGGGEFEEAGGLDPGLVSRENDELGVMVWDVMCSYV